MLVLIIATVVVAGLVAYGVSKSKSKKQVAEETIVPIIETVVEEFKPKKELKLKDRPKQDAKPKQKAKPKQDAKKVDAKPAKKEQKNKQPKKAK